MKTRSLATSVFVTILLLLPFANRAQFTCATNDGNTITITGYTGSGGDVTIPDTINGLPVTSIGNGAFQGGVTLASVMIPDTVTNIGDYAFADAAAYGLSGSALSATGLTKVSIGNGVTRIGDGAFSQSYSLASVVISSNLQTIGNNAFYACVKLTNMTIPPTVTTIGNGAFELTGLRSITIPSSVSAIGNDAFDYCYDLASVGIGNRVASIGDASFDSCFNLGGVYFAGNAPVFGQNEFYLPTSIYCQPGATGWDSVGYPVILWNPEVKTNDENLGVHSNQFGFNIDWTGGPAVVVEACTNLHNPFWVPLGIATFTNGSAHFSDPDWTNHVGRFYRLKNFTPQPAWSGGLSGDDADLAKVRGTENDYASRFRAGDAFVHYAYSLPLPRDPILIDWASEAASLLNGLDDSDPITRIDMDLVQQMYFQAQGP